ncbi:unnamed protein product, partial [Discosporangium mesarthrocarpum]
MESLEAPQQYIKGHQYQDSCDNRPVDLKDGLSVAPVRQDTWYTGEGDDEESNKTDTSGEETSRLQESPKRPYSNCVSLGKIGGKHIGDSAETSPLPFTDTLNFRDTRGDRVDIFRDRNTDEDDHVQELNLNNAPNGNE